MRAGIAALAGLAFAAALTSPALAGDAGDVGAGKKGFAACRICHRVGEGADNMVGPQLNGVVGRPAGSAAGFAYSAAMKGSGLVWSRDQLLAFVKAPRTIVPGTRMTYRGLADDEAARNLVAYLASFRPDGSRTAP